MTAPTITQETLLSPPDFSDVTQDMILGESAVQKAQVAENVGATAVGGPEAVITREVAPALARSVGPLLVGESLKEALELRYGEKYVKDKIMAPTPLGRYPQPGPGSVNAKWGSMF